MRSGLGMDLRRLIWISLIWLSQIGPLLATPPPRSPPPDSQANSQAVPRAKSQSPELRNYRLFSIRHNLSRNEVVYQVQLKQGHFVEEEPIRFYWIMHEKGGEVEEVSFWEKTLAYGVEIEHQSPDKIVFRIESLDRPITVFIGKRGVESSVEINRVPSRLLEVNVVVEEGVFFPDVHQISIIGRSLSSGRTHKEVLRTNED